MGMRAVFLDRDGVLNRAIVRDGKPFPPRSLDEMEILDEAREACRLLRQAGFVLICVTNQPDVSRGGLATSDLARFNDLVRRELGLDDVRICTHDDADHCHCRKPKPGLLTKAAEDFGVDLESSYMIGDRWRDIAAGKSARCTSIFIDRGYAERRPENPDFTTGSVVDGARWILSRETAKS